MSRFLTHTGIDLIRYSDGSAVTTFGGGALFAQRDPLIYEAASGETYEAPAFYYEGLTDEQLYLLAQNRAVAPGVTDGASIPQFARWLLTPFGAFTEPAMIHDMGFKSRGWNGRLDFHGVNALFLEAMLTVRVPKDQAKLIHAAVEHFGKSAWGT